MEPHRSFGWLDRLPVGADLAIAVRDDHGIGLARSGEQMTLGGTARETTALVERIETQIAPRWIWWDRTTSSVLARHDLGVARSWDVTVVQQLLDGGPRRSAAHVWATINGLPTGSMPSPGQLDLGGGRGTATHPLLRADGHLDPDRTEDPAHLGDLAALALRAADVQRLAIERMPAPHRTRSTAHAESACELLCAELEVVGLPFDEPTARRIVSERIGPRPTDPHDETRRRDERDARVLDLVAPSPRFDLRNPADVRSMLLWVGLDLPDTRMWRLEDHRRHHPVVGALVEWRIAERIATTFGHRWLDEHVTSGRLHGRWAPSDGAAGRMTATAGLHNLPVELRTAVRAEAGHRFVRADLGQIEPRVLAAVSGDADLIAATASDDLYRPIAERLGVDRPTAKLAVLGAMYGATTGNSAAALRALDDNFPTAIAHLEHAAAIGRDGGRITTVGGRRIGLRTPDDANSAAAQGRFARNAVIQGAAAEFFKVWAAIVRSRCRGSNSRIVLCLHDELILHVPDDDTDRTTTLVLDALDEAGARWSPHPGVRFVAEVGVAERWSDAD